MSHTNLANDKAIQLTAFLIPNLHCPSCVTHIEDALANLDPKPVSISHSIVNHTVTVRHSTLLKVEAIAAAIETTGYDVHSVVRDPLFTDPIALIDGENGEAQDLAKRFVDRAFERWISGGDDPQELRRERKRHMENCDLCRAKESGFDSESIGRLENISTTSEKTAVPDTESVQQDLPVVVVDASPSVELYEISLSIEGMSCSSCVGKITESFKSRPWVKSVDVNLLTHSASLVVYGEQHVEDITGTINHLGYGSNIERIEKKRNSQDLARQQAVKDVWKASYAIGGLTCSSCVSGITNAVNKHSWVQKIDVNLIANSAIVVFGGKQHLDQIRGIIEELGYEATLDEVEDLSASPPVIERRTVDIRVDGMYCEHCPSKVTNSLWRFDNLTIEKPVTIREPILRVSYVPNAPGFTIRHVLGSISAADPAFNPSVHHPMSLEERSRRMRLREQRQIFYRVALSIVVAVPTFIIGIVYMSLIPSSNPGKMYLMQPVVGMVSRAEWALFAMATPVYFFAGDIFHRRTLKELIALWRPGSHVPIARRFYRFGSMSMLISFGTSIAYFSSIAEIGIAATQSSETSSKSVSYFDSVVFLIMFLLLGRLIEAYSKAKSGDAVASLGNLRPTETLLVAKDGPPPGAGITKVHVDLLEFGDTVRVLHGDSPPCDGVIVEGESKFDESSLTGESVLVVKSRGDMVYSGTVNQGDAVSIQISGVAGSSMLDQIIKVVREGQTRRAPVERVADVIAGYFVPLVTLIAITTWIIWLSLGLSGMLPEEYRDNSMGGWAFWSLQFAIAVFVIACPCGIGLAAPTALFVGGGLAAQHGILVKGGGEAFQEASNLDCIVFDKTGTLTQGGEPTITDYQIFPNQNESGLDEELILNLLKKVEQDSGHPIAKAVVRFCEAYANHDTELLQTQVITGKGIKGSFAVGGQPQHTVDMSVGNEAFMVDCNVDLPEDVVATLDTWKKQAKSVVLVGTKQIGPKPEARPATWNLSAILAVSDPPRPEASTVIEAIQRRGIHVWMISGDNPTTAHAVGAQIGIPKDNIIAGVLPKQKADKIKYLQRTVTKRETQRFFRSKPKPSEGRAIVAMVGDGINDSPALAMADVSIAIGSGSDVAISTAKFVLMTSQLTSVLTLIDLSRVVFRRIKVNFLWACVYNVVALPIAAGVLYPIKSGGSHIRLDPVWAALAMALSSISVVCSSLLLRNKLPIIGFRSRKVISGVVQRPSQ
ncbi:ATPase, P-type, K/Mg/Cd/Cu/Zn/Na/Ca/Na/H-transporter [Penicillium occitanis (nom. inval.)]|nr:ATPase, P-type, K/Mg/Cd/Cu/Zn/Na/Ca/Na/H-transporter [Penicillium occitanis (nom. inval.)]PCG88781.1 hypothetical protein PENOC_109440 [Penicillium occitanis (nom. inval.)]